LEESRIDAYLWSVTEPGTSRELAERVGQGLFPALAPGRGRVRLARAIAVGADALQLFLFPLFGEGFASPVNDALDVAVGGLLIWLVGFHWVLLPSLATELVPGLDLAPTWTAAVLVATGASRDGRRRWLAWALAALLLAGGVAVALWLRGGHGRA
jgi:hypothetical protein